ncbi:AMP-binding protein [Halorarum salinum]|uniref:AMP-binding protein n=1 Tax=Halorarum salinum TaxID=2743089 RepID=A0A7D5LEU2_9EURY|nr:AMP-binding protein [Halobaculum salinum]QLG64275.1 AMP-binding protein [Halobaculum salinum]
MREFTPAPPANEWVGDWSARRARLSPGTVGLVDATTGAEFTYADLDERANRTARLLRERGVRAGDRVAVVSRNRPELVDLFFATGKLGAVLAPLSHRLAPPELAELLGVVDASLLVVEDGLADPFGDVADGQAGGTDDGHADALPDERVVVADEAESVSGAAADLAADAWTDALPEDGSPVERPDVSMDDPHLFLHTGGSTGTPKETVVPHRAVLWNSFNTITAWGLRPEDVTPMTFPMFHTGGWNVLTVPLFHLGGTVVLAREFDAGEVLRVVEERGASVLVAVPAVLRMMATHDDWADADLSTLRFAKSGGGPCRGSVIDAWRERGVDLSQGYGLTECGPNNFAMPDGRDRGKTDAVGVPAMHVDARVVDDAGDLLPDGEVGELELSGPHAAAGYWRNPAESEATFGADSARPADGPDADGDRGSASWVSTGDLARVDADGYYHIEGRKKNMFVSGGENVYPPEVEDVLADHPKVEDAVVVGVPDDTWGTVGKAVVVGDASLTLDELGTFCDGRLARFKRPRALAFVDALPTSGPEKIDRDAVRERFGEG